MSDTGWSEPDADGISVRSEAYEWLRAAHDPAPPVATAKRYYLNREIVGEPEVGPRFPEGENPGE